MAKRFYEPKVAGTELQLWVDPQVFTEVDDQASLTAVRELLALDGLSDEAKVELELTQERFDLWADQELELLDRLDYYDYDDRVENLTVRDGDWFTPEAVESVCGETGTNVVENSIDGDNQTFWRHDANEVHSVIYRLRSYPKRVTKVRFRIATSVPAREQLENLSVYASREIANLGDNKVADALNPVWVSGWNEVDVDDKQQVRYVKLEFQSANANEFSQVREFAVRVETRLP